MPRRSGSSALLLVGLLAACSRRDEGSTITSEHRAPRRVEREATALLERPRLGMMVHAPEAPPSECEIGQTRLCWPPGTMPVPLPRDAVGGARVGPAADPVANQQYKMRCVHGWGGALRWSRAACNTPIVVSFDADRPVTFTGPSPTWAHSFPIGVSGDTEWVSARTPWLAVDRDGSGCIESERELFGPPEDGSGMTGFDKLKQLDENHDGRVDALDPSFGSLVLWFDRDQDKRCVPSEITKLADAGIDSLDLAYTRSAPPNAMSSYEGEHAPLWFRGPDQTLRRGRLIDVYLQAAE